jgi:hypothetical protein
MARCEATHVLYNYISPDNVEILLNGKRICQQYFKKHSSEI